MPANPDDIIDFGSALPYTDSVVVNHRRKLRVKSLVYIAMSLEEDVMGFAFPREERQALVDSRPDTFSLPRASDMRYNWVLARVDALDPVEAREIVLDAWGMVVPKFVFRETVENLGSWTPEI